MSNGNGTHGNHANRGNPAWQSLSSHMSEATALSLACLVLDACLECNRGDGLLDLSDVSATDWLELAEARHVLGGLRQRLESEVPF